MNALPPGARPALLGVIWMLMTVPCSPAQEAVEYFDQKRRLAEFHISGLVRDWQQATGIPGVVIMLVESDQVLLQEGFGLADSDTTVFQVGELVRPVTAMALLQQIERGAIAPGTDISKYLQIPSLDAWFIRPVTPESLLTHSGGFDARLIASRTRRPAELLPLRVYLGRRMPPRIRAPDLVSVPSSHGYALAGLLVETVAGVPFGDYLRASVFEPLGMTDTALHGEAHLLERLAGGHRFLAGRWVSVTPDYPQTSPASSLLTTAADMGLWLRALLSGGELQGARVLTPAGAQQMLSRQFSNHPLLPGRSLGLIEGVRYWPAELYQAMRGNGYSAVLMISPKRHLGLFVAFNGEVDFWDLVHQIFDRFVAIREDPPHPSPTAGSDSHLRFSGYWSDASVPHHTVAKLLALVRQDRIRQTGDGGLMWRSRTYRPIAPLAFQQIDGTKRLCFISSSGRLSFAAADDVVLEKLPWFAAWPVQAGLWVAFAAVFLAAGWPSAKSLHRQPVLSPQVVLSPGWPLLLARLAATFHFLFLAVIAVVLAIASHQGVGLLLYEFPLAPLAVLVLPVVGGVLTLGAIIGLIVVWRSDQWSGGQRLRFAMLTAVLLAFLPFLRYWNLLGFHL